MKTRKTPLIGQGAGSSFRSMRRRLEDIMLRRQNVMICGRRRIRNSKGESFLQYWERVSKTGKPGASIHPLDWSMETESEKAFAKEFKRMSNRELGTALLELSKKVGKYFPLKDCARPLREFVDRLDDYTFNNLYFANIPARLQVAKAYLKQFKGSERVNEKKILKIKKAVENYERTKVLIYEIMTRWNRT